MPTGSLFTLGNPLGRLCIGLGLTLSSLCKESVSATTPLSPYPRIQDGAGIRWDSVQTPLISPEHDNGLAEFDFDAPRLVRFFPSWSDSGQLVGDGSDSLLDSLSEAVWITEADKLEATRTGHGYIDITEHPEWTSASPPSYRQHTRHVYHPPNSTMVPNILPLLSSDEQKANLETFTSFHTRFYNSDTGHASSRWLYKRILNYTNEFASESLKDAVDIELLLWKHSAFKQESVVVRLSPKSSVTDSITIVGAHCDSMNYAHPFDRSPGADDDGSGTITILEAYRGILRSGYIPSSPLEFHFYAAEEGGLLGSTDISKTYAKEGKDVRGMIEFDMTAWVKAGEPERIGVFVNLADPLLSEYLKSLIDKYLDIPWVQTRYPGKAGSDYMSWTLAGYQSCHAVEGPWGSMNPNPHTTSDRIDISPEFSFDHILRFTKLAVAFAVELSEY
ncbi:hypothetical protein D9757_014247 [Collybiopsis confluens]|uniref:Peptide hydrolase n=1 Tax=Collybiopsis confluens TaxID=2823264 RepID=A0A8H5G5P0_9AGAR|nr:hypothetical protein D9757_014247 [Collybiopsis confluens]